MILAFKENNKILENLNDKRLELMNDRVMLTSYLLPPFSKISNPEHTGQIILKDPMSNKVNDLLKKTILITLYDNLLTFRDANQHFELREDLLKKITNKNYNVDLANLSDKN